MSGPKIQLTVGELFSEIRRFFEL